MYLDRKAVVTIAVGSVAEPVEAVVALPFVRKTDQRTATHDEIRAEWRLLKDRPELARKGYRACEAITSLRLTEATMDDLLQQGLDAGERALRTTFPEWDSWPADAQLGVLSLAWALGGDFAAQRPELVRAALARDWIAAAAACALDGDGDADGDRRTRAHAAIFGFAAAVESSGLETARLHYPDHVGQHPSPEE